MATAIATDRDLIDEIQQLKLKYEKDCRIIENIGDFAYVVQVALPKWNVTVKFQVSGKTYISFLVICELLDPLATKFNFCV